MHPDTTPTFSHHRLDAWRVSLELAASVARLADRIPRGHRPLADQLLRASSSCVLLIAEGAHRQHAADKRYRFIQARAECGETAAAVELVAVLGLVPRAETAAVLDLAARVTAMLTRLAQRFA